MAKLIPNRYADALFELAQELNQLDELERDAAVMLDALRGDNTLLACLVHPQISSDEKTAALRAVFKDIVSDVALGFVAVVTHKQRAEDLPAMLETFLAKAKEHKGIVVARVTAAYPLTDAQAGAVAALLAGKLKKQVEVEAVADPSVVGGLSIQVDGRIFDGTLKKKIDDMKTLMQGGTT